LNTNDKQSSATEILHKKFITGSPEREVALESERVNAEVARLVFACREKAGARC